MVNFRGCSEGTGDALPAFGPILNAAGAEEKSVTLSFSHVLIDFHMIAVLSTRQERHGDFQAFIHIVLLCPASFHNPVLQIILR